jgi:site-specific DNA-methyltransferase (adenine-specific)
MFRNLAPAISNSAPIHTGAICTNRSSVRQSANTKKPFAIQVTQIHKKEHLMTHLINTLLKADCIRAMRQLPAASVDFILTDPPYGICYKDRSERVIRNDNNFAWIKPAFAEMYRVLADNRFCVSFYGWTYAERFVAAYKNAGFRIVGHITFKKNYVSSTGYLHSQHECAYLLAKGRPPKPEAPISDVMPWAYSGNHHHPSEKAVKTLLPLIEAFSQPGDLVLDPFCGSASSFIAAKTLGRHYLGIELDPKYHAIARRRLEAVR